MNYKNTALVLATIGFLWGHASPAFSACANCSTWVLQAVEYAEQLEQHVTQTENLKNNIEKYKLMVEDHKALPSHIKQQALADLRELAGIVAAGRAVAYSSGQIDEDYQREYRDFDYYAQQQQSNHDDMAERYRDWSQANHDTVRGALRAAGLQAQQFDREDSALRSIEAQMESAAGTKQLLQAGGSIAAMQVEQLQKLRQLQMAQMQLQASQVGGQVDRQTEDDSAWHRAVAPRDNNPDTQQPIQANDLF